MKNLLIALLIVGLLADRNVSAQAKAPSVRGVWQAAQVTMTGPNPRTITIPEPRPNLTIITARHYSHVQVQSEGPRPPLPDPAKASADELRAAWAAFSGEAGTYEVGTSTITTHPVVAKNPATMSPEAFTTYAIKLQGDTLWLTEQRTQRGPAANPVTIKLVRVE